ncbi:TonB-dependent receptor plug domain-containing protein [Methylocaldum gracile]|jgi:TonB-dependent heme/hemoglobin receptor|uniref:TonB-dependent receptor plug domain-containing protein n=1 Tax=Methylocaldum sp. 0917 TaxID=2485163 RepID=UPI00106132CD
MNFVRSGLALAILVCGYALADQPPTMPAIVVTATQSERDSFLVPQAIASITPEFIDHSLQSMTPDLFRFTPGVYIQKTNQGGGSPFIRGLTGKQVLILVDGVRLNNSFYRFGPHQYLNTIDPNIIERIETVRGPSSVLYGTDALGGAINIITRKRSDFSNPLGYNGLLSAHYESAADAGVFRGEVEGNWNQLGLIAGATGKLYDDLDGGGNLGRQVPSGYDESDADLKLNYRLDENQELIFAGQYTRQFNVPKTSEVTLGDKLKFDYEPQERRFGYLEYRARQLGVFDAVRFNASYNNQREGEQVITRRNPAIETLELTDVDTVGLSLQLKNRIFGDHDLTYGADYYHDDYQTRKVERNRVTGSERTLTPGTPDGATYEHWALYLQDEAHLLDSLEGVFGVRYNRYEARGEVTDQNLRFETDAVAGNINLGYRLTPALNLVGGLAFGFRAPNMEDFFGRVDFFSEIPNTSLKPEESLSKEIGLKYRDEVLSAEIFYFHSDYEGFIDRVTVGQRADGAPIQQRQNINDAEIQGVEASAEYPLNAQWLVGATLTWTEGRDAKTKAPLRRIPPLNGAARLVYYPMDRLWIEGSVWWADNQDQLAKGDIEDPRIGAGGTPGYTVFNLKAGYTPHPQHELLLELENLTDKKYKSHGSGIFAPGLNVLATYRFRF